MLLFYLIVNGQSSVKVGFSEANVVVVGYKKEEERDEGNGVGKGTGIYRE